MRSKIQYFATSVIFYSLVCYLTYHAFSGERGLVALVKLNSEYSNLHNNLENIRADRVEFEHKVSLMRSESLDLDLLEEQAKSILGLANKEEKVIFKEDNK